MSYHFAYLVIAQRSLKVHSGGQPRVNASAAVTTTFPVASETTSVDCHDIDRAMCIALSVEHGVEILAILRRLQPATVREMPDYLFLSTVYAILVMVACHDESPNKDEILVCIQDTLAYCRNAGVSPMSAAETAVATLQRKRTEAAAPPVEPSLADHSHDMNYYGKEGLGAEFPPLEYLFTESFMTGSWDEDWSTHSGLL